MTSLPVAAAPMRPVLPSHGTARVKNVLSGDTVVLVGKAASPDSKPPEIVFTFERVVSPRMASKANANTDDPGAFEAREWLRKLVVGKSVAFETRKQGATAGDRVYGLLFLTTPEGQQLNLAVEAVKNGFATPKVFGAPDNDEDVVVGEEQDPVQDYEQQLQAAFSAAKEAAVGIHSAAPLVRTLKTAGEDFETLALVERSQKLCREQKLKCVIEYIFDGSRMRCHVIDEQMAPAGMQYGSFTLFVAGITCPRMGNPRLNPPTVDEPFAVEARQFVELRLLHRELDITLHGTDKSGICAVGTIHHPRGNIAVELLKNGLAKMSDWSVRMLSPMDVPALRIAENSAKRTNIGIWHSYAPPTLSGASQLTGTVVEVLTGDTLLLLPSGHEYDDESKLIKISLASIRAPRVGNERMGRPDEPFSNECKDRLRVLTVGKPATVKVAYERDIPLGENTENRQFGVVSVGKREDVSEVLVSEGLAVTAFHRDDDETSPRYDELRAAEAVAKAAKKGVHSDKINDAKTGRSINDLTDPKKAKSYSGSLMRAGTLKAIVEYVFNGSRFKLYVPSENCHIVFAPNYLRCPQPSPMPGSRQVKPAEPFGDASKRHARLTVLQRTVDINCTGVTNGGVITGDMFVGQGGQRRNYSLELVGAGLATLDERKLEYGEVPKMLMDAMAAAQKNRVGIWSIEQKTDDKKTVQVATKSKAEVIKVTISEIRSGSHFFYQLVGDKSAKVVDDSMKKFTKDNGTAGAPCDVKPGKVVAALFDDGTGKSWYRAKILTRGERGKVQVLFVDHGNVAAVPLASHLRPLDITLGTDRIPAVAHEAELALTLTRPISDDEGLEAARMLQKLAWGKELIATKYCDLEGKAQVALKDLEAASSINEQLVSAGLARVAKQPAVNVLSSRMLDGNELTEFAAELNVAQDAARKSRSGMWRYGDIGDEDDEE